jgi:pimeloyl-ACP methyl ester carboxylesterase
MRLLRTILAAPAILLLLLLAGCAKQPIHDPELYTHVIDIDSAGNPIHPVDFVRMDARRFDRQLDDMFADLTRWCDDWRRDHPGADDPPPRVLVFVHGGMTDEPDAISRAHCQWTKIRDAGYFPIFVTWNSAPVSAYGEHLFHVRKGALAPGAAWSSPLYFLTDVGRAAFNAPIVWIDSFTHDFNRIVADVSAVTHHDKDGKPELDRRWTDNPEEQRSVLLTGYLLEQYRDPQANAKAMPISVGSYEGQPNDSVDRLITYVLFWPFKLVTAPIIDGGGQPMWENMSRRTNIMFEGAGVTNLRRPPARRAATTRAVAQRAQGEEVLYHPPGAMVAFLTRLEDFIDHRPGQPSKVDVTLVGHSMGCIVLDEFVRRTRESVDYKNIVYMAAACTVREWGNTVVPYLHRHTHTTFYNLCLHPANDVRERHFVDLIPRGSLLVWLDDFLTRPRTPLDRMLGRWDNLVEAAWIIPPGLLPRINVKMFNLGFSDKPGPFQPQNHGDFSWQPYWDERLWRPTPPQAEPTRTEQSIRKSVQQSQ